MSYIFKKILFLGFSISFSFSSQAMNWCKRALCEAWRENPSYSQVNPLYTSMDDRPKRHLAKPKEIVRIHKRLIEDEKNLNSPVFFLITTKSNQLMLIRRTQGRERVYFLKNLTSTNESREKMTEEIGTRFSANKTYKPIIARWAAEVAQEHGVILARIAEEEKQSLKNDLVLDKPKKEKRNTISWVNSTGREFLHNSYFQAEKGRTIRQEQIAYSSDLILARFPEKYEIVVAAYNPRTKEAFLASLNSTKESVAIEKLIEKLGKGKKDNIEIHLVGGHEKNMEFLYGLLSKLFSIDGVQIKTARIALNPKEPRKIAIDPASGAVYMRIPPEIQELEESYPSAL